MGEATPVIGWPDEQVAVVPVDGEFLVLPDIDLADDPRRPPCRPRSSRSTGGYGRPGSGSWKSTPRPASRNSPAHPRIPASRPGPA